MDVKDMELPVSQLTPLVSLQGPKTHIIFESSSENGEGLAAQSITLDEVAPQQQGSARNREAVIKPVGSASVKETDRDSNSTIKPDVDVHNMTDKQLTTRLFHGRKCKPILQHAAVESERLVK